MSQQQHCIGWESRLGLFLAARLFRRETNLQTSGRATAPHHVQPRVGQSTGFFVGDIPLEGAPCLLRSGMGVSLERGALPWESELFADAANTGAVSSGPWWLEAVMQGKFTIQQKALT